MKFTLVHALYHLHSVYDLNHKFQVSHKPKIYSLLLFCCCFSVRALERARVVGSFTPQPVNITVGETLNTHQSDSESSETEYAGSRPHKKLKTEMVDTV